MDAVDEVDEVVELPEVLELVAGAAAGVLVEVELVSDDPLLDVPSPDELPPSDDPLDDDPDEPLALDELDEPRLSVL